MLILCFKPLLQQLLKVLIISCLLLLINPLFAATPYCKDSQLSIHLISSYLLGMDGANSQLYGIINHGSAPCYLRGIPSVKLPLSIHDKKPKFVTYLLTKEGREELIDTDPERSKQPQIMIQPFHSQDTLKQLAYFTIYSPGGGTADRYCHSYPFIKTEQLKLPGIEKPLSISMEVSCFVISEVNKDASYALDEEDKNKACFAGIGEDAKQYTLAQLNALPLKEIISKAISCDY